MYYIIVFYCIIYTRNNLYTLKLSTHYNDRRIIPTDRNNIMMDT